MFPKQIEFLQNNLKNRCIEFFILTEAIFSGSVVNTEKMQLDGVGSLFFTVGDDLAPRLSGQEFLYMSRPCPKSHH